MSSPADRMSLRGIRFVVYITTIFYGLVNATRGPVLADQELTNSLSDARAATIIGVLQLLAAILGLVVDLFVQRWRGWVKWIFAFLSFAFFYEFILVLVTGGEPFTWAPVLVYSAICSVVYLSEG
jgi:hypothetical protein